MTFDISKIKNCFPFDSFREHQEEVLKDIVSAFNSGVDVYLLDSAVGSGKSPIGIAMGRMTDIKRGIGNESVFGSYYSTPQKILQDQLEKDFSSYINVIKGRSSYDCSVIEGNTCKDGKCQYDSGYECEKSCQYVEARDAAVVGQIACSNFSYLIVVSPHLFGKRELLIVDECHSVSSWALNFVSCTIYSKHVGSIPNFKTFDECIEWLKSKLGSFYDKYDHFDSQLRDAAERGEIVLGLKERRDSVKEIIDKIERLVNDYKENKEEWVWQIHDRGTMKERIQFQPVTAGRFLESIIWWRGEKKLLMSGTIFPELFIEEAGLSDFVCEYKEVPSIFPVQNRPIYYWGAGKMTLKDRESTIPKMAEKVAVLINKNPDSKGFMHCRSYDIANKIYQILKPMFGSKVWLQDRFNRDSSLREWMESKEPSLFLSINMTEGVDLKDDLCRYQIVAKVQFPYLGDERVKARKNMKKYRCSKCDKIYRTVKNLDGSSCECGGTFGVDMNVYIYTCLKCNKKLMSGKPIDNNACVCGGKFDKKIVLIDGNYWYDAQAIIDLEQSYGRGVRSSTDKCEFWILDSSFIGLYNKRRDMFTSTFREALRVI